ncbi:Nn.00g042980.m01.CDS01 [Neocucurbitaria sp. VM-36]
MDPEDIDASPNLPTIVSRLGLRIADSFAFPTSASVVEARLTLKYARGLAGTETLFRSHYPSALEYLRAVIDTKPRSTFYARLARKLWKLGPVRVVPSHGAPDSALIGINLEEEEKITELENDLTATLVLRSAPHASLLLSDIAAIDSAVYEKILYQFLYTSSLCGPAVARSLSEELQSVTQQKSLALPRHSKPAVHPLTTSTLTERRGLNNLTLDNLQSLNTVSKDHDYILFAHKLRENPDLPIAPWWHAEATDRRSWLDAGLKLCEDSAGGFFVHEVFLKKVFHEYNNCRALPHAGKLRTIRASAAAEAKKMMKVESEAAIEAEPNRLLQCKIEHLIPEVATTEKQLKALRLIALQALDAVEVLKFSDSAVVTLLKAEMQRIMNNKDQTVDLEENRICDIISEYSDDIDEDYWSEQSVLDVICNERKREKIMLWISSTEESNIVHFELYNDDRNYAGPLEPLDGEEETVLVEIKLKTEQEGLYEYPKILFNRDADDNIVLPLDDGYELGRSEGHYTNMSGFTAISISDSSSSSGDDDNNDNNDDDDEDNQNEPLDSSPSSEEPSPPTNPQTHKQRPSAPNDKQHSLPTALCLTPPPPLPLAPSSPNTHTHTLAHKYTYPSKRAALTLPSSLNARRLNTLHMAFALPHESPGPAHAGMRPREMGKTRRAPDGDCVGGVKAQFAQQQRKDMGMLDRFNEEWDAREAEAEEERKRGMGMGYEDTHAILHGGSVGSLLLLPPPRFDVTAQISARGVRMGQRGGGGGGGYEVAARVERNAGVGKMPPGLEVSCDVRAANSAPLRGVLGG